MTVIGARGRRTAPQDGRPRCPAIAVDGDVCYVAEFAAVGEDMIYALSGLILLALVGAPSPEVEATVAAGAVLRDQFGRPDSLTAHAGRPQVVLVVSARRLRRLKEWEVELARRLDGVGFLRVADVPAEGGTPPTFDDVASTLRRRVPQSVPVLVDTERLWAGSLRLDTREVNVLAFDADTRMVAHVRGAPRAEAIGPLESALLALPGVRRKAAAERPSGTGARP